MSATDSEEPRSEDWEHDYSMKPTDGTPEEVTTPQRPSAVTSPLPPHMLTPVENTLKDQPTALLTANVKAPVQPVANVSPMNVGQFRGVLNQPQQLVLVNQPFQAAGSGPLFAIPAASLHQMIKSGTFKLQPMSNQVAVTPASTPPASTPKQELAATPAAVPNKDASEDAETKRTVAKSKVDKGKPMEKRKRSSSKDGSAQYKIPRKSEVDVKPRLGRTCEREGCNKLARPNAERGPLYCGNDCVVEHCKSVFESWIGQQQRVA
ncbi:TOX high mobility group box family member 4-like [Oscarella lobularis]|uniref:TOX high mobility group box family member 4-like n=1 Tax=Oscarella lobularis TaxID=121494 RepID=UPI003313CC9A